MAGLKGKVVLITGASSGIGEGTALYMATLGCKLSLIGRNLEALNAVSEKCKEAGSPDVYLASHDLAEEKECIATINETVEHFGGNVNSSVACAKVFQREFRIIILIMVSCLEGLDVLLVIVSL